MDKYGDKQWTYMFEGEYKDDMRWGYGVLKEVKAPNDSEGERYVEYQGFWENDFYHGKGRLLVYESKLKTIKFEEHDGSFKYGMRDGLGKSIRLKEGDMYGDDEEFRKELLRSHLIDYLDFIGDFYNDKPVYHSGVLKNVKLPPPPPMT
jgi:hypothetical protein